MNAKRMTFISLFAVLTIIAGYIQFPVGPVPITLQTLLVIMSAIALKPIDALLSMLIHFILRLLLSGGTVLTAPSLGFVLGFIPAAFISAGYIRKKYLPERQSPHLLVGIVLAALIPYLLGLPIMSYIMTHVIGASKTTAEILQLGLIPFIPGDLLKMVLAYLIARRLKLPLSYE